MLFYPLLLMINAYGFICNLLFSLPISEKCIDKKMFAATNQYPTVGVVTSLIMVPNIRKFLMRKQHLKQSVII